MRSVRLLVAAVLLTGTAWQSASAQDDRQRVGVIVGAGVSVPLPDFTDLAKPGVHLSGGGWMRPARFAHVSFVGLLSFDRFALNLGGPAKVYNFISANTEIISASAIARYYLEDADRHLLHTYLLGGIGVSSMTDNITSEGKRLWAPRITRPAIYGGAGVAVNTDRVRVFVEARLQSVFAKDKGLYRSASLLHFVPVMFGVQF